MFYGYFYEVFFEIEVGDYRIFEGDLFFLNYWFCYMDYIYWKCLVEFWLENFIDFDGDFVYYEVFLLYGLGEWFLCLGIIVVN